VNNFIVLLALSGDVMTDRVAETFCGTFFEYQNSELTPCLVGARIYMNFRFS